ncbi:MFS transporter [Kitasatospora phosalacinea]|uniref:MFS transporter n=1 Tax=Kitasatospora phosalacinea TaxID=2065 RepID=A0A9W6PGB5_9ACTN|nr:MFS transporter [Kitasatospora phosalacinea]GLW54393.1 MFS transporter [Kitasatospora phosalacinea]
MATPTHAPARAAQGGPALRRGTLVAGLLAVCTAQIGLAIPATLNGLFQSQLHPVGSQLTWISDAFLLPVAVLELTFGLLGDLLGRKRLLVGGAALLAVGEIVSTTANGIHQLWVGQALAGLGAAALFPTSLAILAAGAATTAQRAKVVALWAALLSTGGFVAPLIGGITATYGSWRWAFVVVTLIGAASALTSAFCAGESRAPEGRSLDLPGQLTIGVGLFALLYAIIQGPEDGWTATPVLIALVLAVLGLAGFVAAELRSSSPLLRLDLFRNRSFAVASVITVVGMFSFLGTAYSVSIRLGPVQELPPMRTALAFLLLNGIALAMLPVTHRLLNAVAPRLLLGSGLLLIAAGNYWAAALPVHDHSFLPLIAPLALVGLGFAVTVSSVTATAVTTVPPHLAGMASATTNLLRDFGFTLGPAVIGAIALSRASDHFTSTLGAADLPAPLKGAGTAILEEGGPLAVNGASAASPKLSALHPLAESALGTGYSLGFVVCGCAALFAALLALLALRGRAAAEEPTPVG